MRSNKRKNTTPELQLRKLLHARGLRYRVDFPPDPKSRRRRADIVFTKVKLVVFIDGCFWHGCPIHATVPLTNRSYWEPKLRRNKERDTETNEHLERLGWTVIRVWEHEIPENAASLIAATIERLRDSSGHNPV